MNNTQTQTASTDKPSTKADVSIQAGISLLRAKEPNDRGEAFKVLKKADLTGTGQWFNAVITGYQETTGIELQKSERAQARAEKDDALKWAHNANAAEVEHICATAGGKGPQFWAAWQLHKEGKWPDIDTDKTFKQHFTEQPVNKELLSEAIKTLNAAKPTTRGEAFNSLKNDADKVDSHIYTAAVKAYEEASQTTLSKGVKRQEADAIAAKVHAISVEDLREHIGALEEPDSVFWKAWSNCKEGAWNGEITREDFTPLFNKNKGQAADTKQTKQTQAAVEMDDDFPF